MTAELFETTQNSDVTTILIAQLNTMYALRITDTEKATSFLEEHRGDSVAAKEARSFLVNQYGLQVIRQSRYDCRNNGCTLDEYFDTLNDNLSTFLNNMQTGLSLYRGKQNTNGDLIWEAINN